MDKNRLLIRTLYIILAIATIIALKDVMAKQVKRARSQKAFYRLVREPKHNLSIALFYRTTKKMKCDDKRLYNGLSGLKSMFANTSGVFRYDDADLLFVSVNLADVKDYNLERDFQIDETPVFVLIKDGEPLRDASGNIKRLYGFTRRGCWRLAGEMGGCQEIISRSELQGFIDSNFAKELKQNYERNKEIRKRRLEERSYWGCGLGWGYPYGGWGGYYGYPGWGCGIGLGWRGGYGYSGCGYRRGCGGCRRGCARRCGGCRR